jgi:hypothetical protein
VGVDSLKVSFQSSEGIKKEGRIPIPPFLHHVHSCYIFRKLLIPLIGMLCGLKLEQCKRENVLVQLLGDFKFGVIYCGNEVAD